MPTSQFCRWVAVVTTLLLVSGAFSTMSRAETAYRAAVFLLRDKLSPFKLSPTRPWLLATLPAIASYSSGTVLDDVDLGTRFAGCFC